MCAVLPTSGLKDVVWDSIDTLADQADFDINVLGVGTGAVGGRPRVAGAGGVELHIAGDVDFSDWDA